MRFFQSTFTHDLFCQQKKRSFKIWPRKWLLKGTNCYDAPAMSVNLLFKLISRETFSSWTCKIWKSVPIFQRENYKLSTFGLWTEGMRSIKRKYAVYWTFFHHLAALSATFSQWQGGGHTHLIFINHFVFIDLTQRLLGAS